MAPTAPMTHRRHAPGDGAPAEAARPAAASPQRHQATASRRISSEGWSAPDPALTSPGSPSWLQSTPANGP